VHCVTDKLEAIFSVQYFDESAFINNLEGILRGVEFQVLKFELSQVLQVESEWIEGLSFVPLKEGLRLLNDLVLLLGQFFSQ
jgi:hypothetical protein